MIFATVGTHGQQFDRMMRAVETAANGEECIVQYGHSTYLPQNATAAQFMPFEEMERLMREARVVITHAGTGTVMYALSLGKAPVVMPRLSQHGEHVDNHQLELVESLGELGLIVPCMPDDNLADKIAEAASKAATRRIEPSPALVNYLKDLVERSAA